MTPPSFSLINLGLENIAAQAIRGDLKLNDFVNDPRDISLLCESCSIPGRAIQTADYDRHGLDEKGPTGLIFDDVTMSFIVTQDFYTYKLFERWQDLIIDHGSYTASYRSDYVSDVIINILDEKNFPAQGIRLVDAYPVATSAIELNHSAEEYARISVTLTYRKTEEYGPISSLISSVRETAIGSLKRLI
jgi:hypothetical protein